MNVTNKTYMCQFTSIHNYYEHTLSKVQACRSLCRASNVNKSQSRLPPLNNLLPNRTNNAKIARVFVYTELTLAPLI